MVADLNTRIHTARSLIGDFVKRTNLENDAPSTRYLWTDAFAVFAMIELSRTANEPAYLDMAKRLVDDVHRTLGRHREDDARSGWISGLSEAEGEAHPTRGGLRIGKQLMERMADEPYNEQLEWDRDGQYFHYLTKWMHALNRLSIATGEPHYNEWAIELARVAYHAFVSHLTDVGRPRIHWKMSIDLSRPQVTSTGQLDPLDGFVTLNVLRTVGTEPGVPRNSFFEHAANEFLGICDCMRWVTGDALGIGGLLADAAMLLQLISRGSIPQPEMLDEFLADTVQCLRVYERYEPTDCSPGERLAFRELGLSIGLHGCELMRESLNRAPERFKHIEEIASLIHTIGGFAHLRDPIERRWLDEQARATSAWKAHQDINAVMLATSLLPGAYLTVPAMNGSPTGALTDPGVNTHEGDKGVSEWSGR